MISTLALAALLAQDPPAKVPMPLYDGARDFAAAIEAAAAEDPKFLEAVEPFATGYWLWRTEILRQFNGDWILQELILCGKMVEKWEPKLGEEIRRFALQAVLENPEQKMGTVMQSDLRLAYVNRLGQYNADKTSVDAALYDAGTRLADLTAHLVFAEFVDAAELKTNATPALRSCGKFGDDKPKAPADLRARVSSIGNLTGTIPFTSETMREAGFRVARALATQVPEKFRWKIPPDPPKTGGG